MGIILFYPIWGAATTAEAEAKADAPESVIKELTL